MQSNTFYLNGGFTNKAVSNTTTYSTSFPYLTALPFEEVYLLSSASISSCDIEAIESLFCLKGTSSQQETSTPQQSIQPPSPPSTPIFMNGIPMKPRQLSNSPKKDNPKSGKRVRFEPFTLPARKKETLLDDYLEKAKELINLSEEEIYKRLFDGFHLMKEEVSKMISTKDAGPLLNINRKDPVKKNLIRMIFALHASVEKKNEASIRFGRNLARYPALALVITSMRPFRAVSSNDMCKLAKSIGLTISSKFKEVFEEKMSTTNPPLRKIRRKQNQPPVDVINPQQFDGVIVIDDDSAAKITLPTSEDSTKSYCNWLLNLTNPLYNKDL